MSNRKYRRAAGQAYAREERRLIREAARRAVKQHPPQLPAAGEDGALDQTLRFLQGLLTRLETAMGENYEPVAARIGVSICRAILAGVRLSGRGTEQQRTALAAHAKALAKQVEAVEARNTPSTRT